MDCQHARQLLDAARCDGGDVAAPELRAAVVHRDRCEDCRGVVARRERFDVRLSEAMSDVAIPAGLEQRLLAKLVAEVPLPTPAAEPARSSRRWIKRLSLAAAVMLVVAGWYLQRPRFTPLGLDDLYTRLDRELAPTDAVANGPDLSAFDASFNAVPSDAVWRESLAGAAPQGVDLDALPGHDAAAYRFKSGRVSGWLLVLPRNRVTNPPEASLPVHANLRYGPRPQVAWSSGDHVYVCVLERGSLDDLRRQFYGSAA